MEAHGGPAPSWDLACQRSLGSDLRDDNHVGHSCPGPASGQCCGGGGRGPGSHCSHPFCVHFAGGISELPRSPAHARRVLGT